MSNPPHGISVDDYYQEQIAKPFEMSSKLESLPPPGLSPPPPGLSQEPSQMMMRTNHGSIAVRMKLITPSAVDIDRYSGNGYGTTLPRIPSAGRKSSRASFPPSCYGSPYESLHPHEIKEEQPLDNRIVDNYWVNPGARTDTAVLTEAAWRNRFRESTAKVNWRQKIQEETDRDRRERRLEWTVGYTGHIPRLRYGFGLSNTAVSSAVFSPPPAVPRDAASPTSDGVQRLSFTRSGQRQLAMAVGTAVPGTGFLSTARPTIHTPLSDVYTQGTRVRLQGLYKACEAAGYSQLRVTTGNPAKNRSSIEIGDPYFLCGKHMYQTTSMEAFPTADRPALDPASSPKTDSEREEHRRARIRSYDAARAVVGSARVKDLARQVGTALAHKVPGGVGHRRRMYEMFDRQRRGAIGLEEFRTGCFELGLRLSPVEALAVFGFCDARVDGLVNYYEFIDVLVPDDSSEPHRHDNRYYAIYGMDDDDNSTAATAASPTSGH